MLRALLRLFGLYAIFGVIDAATAQTRWKDSAQTAQPRWLAGVQNSTKDPTALAAAQANKMLQGVQQAVQSGYWQRRLADAGKAGWIQGATDKQNNYGNGISNSGTKYQAGYAAFWNYMTPYLNQILAMPKTSIADSIARASAFIQYSSQYQKP